MLGADPVQCALGSVIVGVGGDDEFQVVSANKRTDGLAGLRCAPIASMGFVDAIADVTGILNDVVRFADAQTDLPIADTTVEVVDPHCVGGDVSANVVGRARRIDPSCDILVGHWFVCVVGDVFHDLGSVQHPIATMEVSPVEIRATLL